MKKRPLTGPQIPQGTQITPSGDAQGTGRNLPSVWGEAVPQHVQPSDSQHDAPAPAPTYCLELRVRPARTGHAWDASLQGTTPEGRAIERREFASLMDLMRFLEALVTASGLR